MTVVCTGVLVPMATISAYTFNNMSSPGKLSRRVFEAAIAFIPWLISLYLLYWLEYGEIWTTQTAHRGKISVAILVVGMTLSFLIHSFFARRAAASR